MKVSVIGSNGLLSNSIVKYCNKNDYSVFIYGRTDPKEFDFESFTPIDLLRDSLEYSKLLDSDMIVYAAGAGIQSNKSENANLIYNLNVTVPVRICNDLKSNLYSGTFVSFGSYFEIGENQDDHCFDEIELLQSQRRVVNDYSVSKRMFSEYISSADMPYSMMHFILPTIYGENEAVHRLIPYTINALRTNAKIAFTSGEQVRQYIYIDEVIDIIFKAFSSQLASGIYNIEGTETFTVKELVSKLFELHKQQLSESVFGKTVRTDTGMKNLQLNGKKLYKAIDCVPKIILEDVYEKY